MRDIATGSFNKEKLIFLAGSAVVAVGLYLFITTGPIPLEATPPIAYGQAKPAPLVVPPPPERREEDWYVVDGKVSKLLDKRTNALVNRERISPFEPFKTAALAVGPKVAAPKSVVPPPPVAVVAPPEEKEEKPTWDPKTAKAKVEFMGVMTMDDGETFGLLKPSEGEGSPMRVKKGSKIEVDGEKYTVTDIEPQAIWVTDDEDRPYMLKDMMFEQTADADSDASKSATNSKDPKAVAAADPKALANPHAQKPQRNGQQRPPKKQRPTVNRAQ